MSYSTNWSMSEDVQLCISYCRQSVDPISGSKQKVDKLWEKIRVDFQANWARSADEVIVTEPRTQIALSSRFGKLKKNLILWGACISYARRNPESGSNVQDEIRKAQTMYVAQRKKTFIHFECWEQVKSHQTFALNEPFAPPPNIYEHISANEEVNASETPIINLSGEETTFSTPENNAGGSSSPVRPPGVKAAKEARRKGKKVGTPTNIVRDEALQTIAENQRQQLVFQEKQLVLAREQMEHTHKMQELALNAKKLEDEAKIMQMNTDIMTPKSKKYFSKRKAAILQHYEEEEDLANEGNTSREYDDCYRPSRYND